jgi:hypothetical protein
LVLTRGGISYEVAVASCKICASFQQGVCTAHRALEVRALSIVLLLLLLLLLLP